MNALLAVLLVSSGILVSADQIVQDSYNQFESEAPPQHLPQLNQPKFNFGDLTPFEGRCHQTPIDPDADCIPGVADVDYPIFTQVPPNLFDCAAQQFPGLYADTEFRCQVFHICDLERVKHSFLCPKGTILDQRNFVCVWWFNFNCADAPIYYFLNEGFYNTSIPPPVAPIPLPGPVPEAVPVRMHPTALTPPRTPVQPVQTSPPTPAPLLTLPPTPAPLIPTSPPTQAPLIPSSPPTPAHPVPAPLPTPAHPAQAPSPVLTYPVNAPLPTPTEPVHAPLPVPTYPVNAPLPSPTQPVHAPSPVPTYPVHAPIPARSTYPVQPPPQAPQFQPAPQPHTRFSPQRVHPNAGHKAYVGAAPVQGNRMPVQSQPMYNPPPNYAMPAYPPAYQPAATPFVPETRPANYF